MSPYREMKLMAEASESNRLQTQAKLDRVTADRDALQRELEQQKRYVEINADSAHGKHMEGLRYRDERDALQQRLTAADEQIDLLIPRHTEQPEGKRERFEKWVMATNHPVYGFLDGRSLARGDDRTGYADEYVQGLWVAYLAFGVEQHAPVAVPERLEMTDGLHSYEYVTGHNAAIDKMWVAKS
ncbi:hypothetical protein SOM46_09445 [Pseudomonas fluorescens]|uniref:hypothetical protein n=1 Tax=Pseudomonas fluorescens TaxID=294 RepID=UPI0017808BC6|nr:hypothetical protein [Pseudomonas fluorescens]MBD8235609.1 hypothetical protein [Pseudomonas fluorescens]MDY0895176.1 hypothetical protein [Pseudomonas fluorescens]